MDPLAFLEAGGWCICTDGDVHLLDLPNVSGLTLCGKQIHVDPRRGPAIRADRDGTLDQALYMADLCCTHCAAIYRRRRFHHPKMF